MSTANDVSNTVNAKDWVTRAWNSTVNVEVSSDIAPICVE